MLQKSICFNSIFIKLSKLHCFDITVDMASYLGMNKLILPLILSIIILMSKLESNTTSPAKS
jgi:hypothetical protein